MRSPRRVTSPDPEPGAASAPPAPRSGEGVNRRAFLATGVAAGVGAGLAPLGTAASALADKPTSHKLRRGDAAILRFLAAAEILETDCGSSTTSSAASRTARFPEEAAARLFAALEKLDEDMPQYIHDNTEDEFTHFTFLNAYLESRGAEPVNLDRVPRRCRAAKRAARSRSAG